MAKIVLSCTNTLVDAHRVCTLTTGVRSKVHTDSQVDSMGMARRSQRHQFSMSICSHSRFRCNADHRRLRKGPSDSVTPTQLPGLLQLVQARQQHPLWPSGGRRRKRCCPKCRSSDLPLLKIMYCFEHDAKTGCQNVLSTHQVCIRKQS